jgi:hypothetical protein
MRRKIGCVERAVLWVAGILGALPCGAGADSFRTVGPVAEAPIQVGCWAPLAVETPPWVFPMVNHMDDIPPMSTEAYAMKFVETIRSFPPDRPVWIQSHRWLGNYRPMDRRNVLSFAADNTPAGTPGIWPAHGKKYWLSEQRKFLAILKSHGCRLDMWPLDHETTVQEWALNWSDDFTFRNIVLDPRWKTEPVDGLGLTGSQLLDPAELEKETAVWTRSYSHQGPAYKDMTSVRDSRLACHAVTVAATWMPEVVLKEVFAAPILEAYPHAVVSDYQKYPRPISALAGTVNDEADAPRSGSRDAGMKPFWNAVRRLRPDLKRLPGVGNAAAPAFYGQKYWADQYPDAGGTVGGMLAEADAIIAHYGGNAGRLTPWITLPGFADRFSGKRLTPEEYRRLLVGLAERGVRQFILWFDPATMNTPENNAEFLEAIRAAEAAARKRLGGT